MLMVKMGKSPLQKWVFSIYGYPIGAITLRIDWVPCPSIDIDIPYGLAKDPNTIPYGLATDLDPHRKRTVETESEL